MVEGIALSELQCIDTTVCDDIVSVLAMCTIYDFK